MAAERANDRAVASWAEHDARYALDRADRDAIRATEAVRWLVLDLFGAGARDLFNACARLGRLMAEAGASPSLAANTIDGAVWALADAGVSFDASRVAAARASLIEGYIAAVRDAAWTASLAHWEYPACAVPLEHGAIAIACGYPTGDGEALADWAARTVGRLVKANVRRVVLSGPEAAKAEVASAAALVGIEIVASMHPEAPDVSADGPRAKRWLRLPFSWRK
jgi:hypothetical protein